MVKKSTYVMLAVLVFLFLLLIADPSQGMETVYLCTKMTSKTSNYETIITPTYDSNGNVLFIDRSVDGVSYTAYRFTYDDQNNPLSKTRYSNNDEVDYLFTYTYEQYRTIVTHYYSSELNFIETLIYTYDAFGNLISQKQCSNESSYENIQTYDLLGNLLTSIKYQEGREIIKHQYTYDVQGRCLSYTKYDGVYEYRYEYSYDENGNQIGITEYRNNKLQEETTNTFDTRGNLIKEVQVSGNGGSTTTTTYTYDSQNRILSEYNSHSLSYKYEYDSVGNIIKKTSHYRGRVQSIAEYKYVAIRVPADQAKKIREMQTEVFRNQPE